MEGEWAIRRMTNSIRPYRLASLRWTGEAQTRDEREPSSGYSNGFAAGTLASLAHDADRTGAKAIVWSGGVVGDGEPGR
jgi:hypothetical protein